MTADKKTTGNHQFGREANGFKVMITILAKNGNFVKTIL
jgi:hypothetical protein